MARWIHVALAVAAAGWAMSCAPPVRVTTPDAAVASASLWEQPEDLSTRDLYYGPWGPERAPDPDVSYALIEHKHTGVNPGMTVRDARGQSWSVKQPPHDGSPSEGPIEVVVSRVLSAVGYHQPPVYYLPSFTLTDDWGSHTEPGGRFRLKDAALKDRGEWSWQQNPFVGTKPYQGLLVILMLFASSDLKNSNNTVYAYRSAGDIELWYSVRDLGTAFGSTGRLAPRRGDPDAFDRHRVFKGIQDGFVTFNFHGRHKELVTQRITPADVLWACDLLSQLSERQWSDAFRAAGYSDHVAGRLIGTLQRNIADGRATAAADPGVQRGG